MLVLTRAYLLSLFSCFPAFAAHADAGGALPAGLAYLPTLLAPACVPLVQYEPLPVYASPGGMRSGELVLDRPDWAQGPLKDPKEPCLQSPKLEVQLNGQSKRVPAPVFMARDEPTLLVQEVRSGPEGVWLRFGADGNRFWLPQARGALFKSLAKDLVQGLGLFTEICDSRGECRPTSDLVRRAADSAALARSPNCPAPAYLIAAHVTLSTGRAAYHVQLAPELLPQFGDSLPVEAIVPVTDFGGQWTGLYNPSPCSPPQGDLASQEQRQSKTEAPQQKAPPAQEAVEPISALRHIPVLPPSAGARPRGALGLPPLLPPGGASPGLPEAGGHLEFRPD